MKIYTSYYANLKNIPADALPVSISISSPYWLPKVVNYNKLAPTRSILDQYKASPNEVLYTERFINEVLSKLDVSDVINDIKEMLDANNKSNIVLFCYESPDKFCHRHIVAQWLSENGFFTIEFKNKKGLL